MYLTEEILQKLNSGRKKDGRLASDATPPVTLPDIMVRSFAEVKQLAGDSLSWGEKNFLYQAAQAELKENKMAESRILSRANPQLANAVRLGIRQSSMLGGYDDLFPQRASSFVKPGAVASMFSPAGYLTELYREARGLHPDTSQYHLDTRRPDLASLSLSQANMDDELSTLSLSNELLLNNIEAQTSKEYDGVMEMLSTYRQTAATPFHLPYEAVRQSILLQDPEFSAFRRNPSVAAQMDAASLLGIVSDISPELREILTEEITDANADELITKNFGEIAVTAFQSPAYLARWYGLTYDEVTSLLGMVTTNTYSAGVQYYQNDQLISLRESDGKLNAGLMTRTPGGNYSQFGYAELLPAGGDNYQLRFTVKNGIVGEGKPVNIGTSGAGSADLLKAGSIAGLNTLVTLNVTIDGARLARGVTIGVTRYNAFKSGHFYASVRFQKIDYSFSSFLLKLNKLIRLYKATGISPSDIRTVIESSNSDLTITAYVLSQLFWVSHYMQAYGVDVSDALVMSGAAISQINHDGQASAFTRLFNTPMLNYQEFSADGTALSLKPGASDDSFRLGVLKRAFGVNDTELYTLWSLAKGSAVPEDYACTGGNLSTLYRISLLAQVHNLTVTELAALLSVSPYAGKKLEALTAAELSQLTSFLAQYTQWLKAQGWTTGDLYLMLTDRYSTTLSPEIENLVTTLKNGMVSKEIRSGDDAALITPAAPFIAAATQLDSAETAAAILQWLDQLKPRGLTFDDFLSLAGKDSLTADETTQLVSFCQVMGQLALIVRNTGLSAAELSWMVAHPAALSYNATTLPHDINTLHKLTGLHALLARCGTYATEVLTSLSGKASSANNNLAIKTVAAALNLDEQALTQALAQNSGYAYFYHWGLLDSSLQWLDVATTLGITPADVKKLVSLNFNDPAKFPSRADWVDLSHTLQAGLNARQTAQLQAVLDEATSSAVSAYVIKNIAPSWVNDRDRLYSWLLIDNQVSAQVKTTRLAEAIASVQLYVNRALSGQEDGVDNAVKSGQFFGSDWDTYNKRYSTWAGVSELVYYPENYVDPTMRIGQTGMMDEMLQTLSQSQLTGDTVEGAFKTYMTRFEEIANLDIISGYHDSVSDQSGITYIIGRSAIGDYYWRSADIGKMSDGKLPANAWSEWKKITAGISPVKNLIRPVIFQSRLYLTWVESREAATTDDNGKTTSSTEYLLKYAHILHDGTWSAPVSVTLRGTLPLLDVDINDTGMYCARDAEQEKLYLFFYKKADSYSALPVDIAGVYLYQDGATENIPTNPVANMKNFIYHQLDTTSAVRLNTPYTAGDTKVSISGARQTDYQWGDGTYTIMQKGSVTGTSASVWGDDGKVILDFNAVARVVYNGYGGSRSRTLVDMMKAVGSAGSVFYAPEKKMRSNIAVSSGRDFECVFYGGADSTGKGSFAIKVLDGIAPAPGDEVQAFSYGTTEYLEKSNKPTVGHLGLKNKESKLWSGNFIQINAENYLYAFMSPDDRKWKTPNELLFGDFRRINTKIDMGQVALTVTGAGSGDFTATTRLKYTLEESLFNFEGYKVTVPFSAFNGNTAQIFFKMSATAPADDGRFLGSETFSITLTRVDESATPVISLNKTPESAQYLQYGVYRIRVNTLFAKQLVARANAGLNTVLSMETQQLQEPKLGEGSYVDVRFGKYDKALHGDGWYKLYLVGATHNIPDGTGVADKKRSSDLCTSGNVSLSGETSVRVFLPYNADKKAELGRIYISVEYSDLPLSLSFANMHVFDYKNANFVADSGNATKIRGLTSTVLNSQTEPMDFSGANALYFWEMFYYVPMMVFKRLLSEGRFTEATQWIKYVWSPDGYLVNGNPAPYQWNVRPLEEETAWHANPLDSVDPDAVSQADPLHYKVATFMSYLDLLIARGDAAYRQLERDTLNEAKMWYVQALDVLGDEPYLTQATGWASPRLGDAADKTKQVATQQALLDVRQGVASGELKTANSLTALFLPQQNEKLAGYWQTLAQRLYNLRHNLSIDGSPLSLAIYAAPADPAALLSAAVMASQGGGNLPAAVMPLYRFPVMLENARGDGEPTDPVRQHAAQPHRASGCGGPVGAAADPGG